MTETERKLLVHLLGMGRDVYANHGCNDFDLSEHIPDKAERDAFVRAYHRWNGDPEWYEEQPADDKGDYRMPDFAVMSFMAFIVEAGA